MSELVTIGTMAAWLHKHHCGCAETRRKKKCGEMKSAKAERCSTFVRIVLPATPELSLCCAKVIFAEWASVTTPRTTYSHKYSNRQAHVEVHAMRTDIWDRIGG